MNTNKLKIIQQKVAENIYQSEENFPLEYFELIIGIDLAFLKTKEKEIGLVCFSIFYPKNQKITYFWDQDKIKFPYIPGFLAFRELPIINKLYKKLQKNFNSQTLCLKTLFFVDGHGISHPRKAGIASHFGYLTNTFSVGLAKKLLYGQALKSQNNQILPILPILDPNTKQIIAFKITSEYLRRKKIMNSNHLIISVGNKLNLNNALNLFLEIYEKYKIIPTELAHNHLQKIKKEFL
ncbi:MAG: endonuclease V [bacterium]